jgi:two-component system, OmpR family, phosphate regulon sensor histidine kinase PhoR
MNKSPRKIWLILFTIILIPILIFSVYQLTTLNENEKIVRDIYTKQLDAILYSVNQYSEDVVSSWRSKLERINAEQNRNERLKEFINETSVVKFLFIADSAFIINYKSSAIPADVQIISFLALNKTKIKNLYDFKQAGYNRIEPVNEKFIVNSSSFLFLIDNQVCGLAIDPLLFVRTILEPKLQEVSQDEFVLTVYNRITDSTIYATGNIQNDIVQYKELWLLREFSIGISLKGASIQELAQERVYTNVILVLLLAVLLIAGNYFVFRNFKKEIELAQIKSDFVSNVSHELRTPLSLINMFAETLELGRVKTEEKKKEYYSIISTEANRLSRIVNKILNFSKMEAGKKTYNFSKTDINEVVENIFGTYKFHLQNNGFGFSLNKENDLPKINADSEAVSEALINLIDNAVKYSSNQKEIIINTGREKEKIFIEVEDRGIGISPEDQKKIYEKFFRVSSGLVHNTKGTGLGLTIVKHIMDAHSGEIKLKSNPDKGSCFRLEFKINNSN